MRYDWLRMRIIFVVIRNVLNHFFNLISVCWARPGRDRSMAFLKVLQLGKWNTARQILKMNRPLLDEI